MSDAPPDRARPHLLRRGDGVQVLVEGTRYMTVSDDVADALARTLGKAVATGDLPPASPVGRRSIDIDFTTQTDGLSLLEHVPLGSSVVVVGATEPTESAGRVVVPMAPNRAGPTGTRALDQVALARAGGPAFLLVGDKHSGWLGRSADLADHLARRATIVAVNNAGVLWALPTAPPSGKPKVFGIGLNKTGTTSLHLACELLGLRSFHWGDRQAFDDVLRALRDGERLLQYVGEEHDAYFDIETLARRFDLADVQYPGSRFILTVRDVDGWIDSRRRHVERNRRNQLAGTYHGTNTRIDEELWRRQWQAHFDRVVSYFCDRDDLLVLNLAAGDGWQQLAPFLGRSLPNGVPFPRGNVDHHAEQRQADTTVPDSARRLPARVASRLSDRSKRVLRRLRAIRETKR